MVEKQTFRRMTFLPSVCMMMPVYAEQFSLLTERTAFLHGADVGITRRLPPLSYQFEKEAANQVHFPSRLIS
jgi:hypothetical protein